MNNAPLSVVRNCWMRKWHASIVGETLRLLNISNPPRKNIHVELITLHRTWDGRPRHFPLIRTRRPSSIRSKRRKICIIMLHNNPEYFVTFGKIPIALSSWSKKDKTAPTVHEHKNHPHNFVGWSPTPVSFTRRYWSALRRMESKRRNSNWTHYLRTIEFFSYKHKWEMIPICVALSDATRVE
jgi:hypothetical protein